MKGTGVVCLSDRRKRADLAATTERDAANVGGRDRQSTSYRKSTVMAAGIESIGKHGSRIPDGQAPSVSLNYGLQYISRKRTTSSIQMLAPR